MSSLPLTAVRIERAKQVIAGVKAVISEDVDRACVIGIMMACAEAALENPASYAVPASISYDHDWIAKGDHLSVGIQQAQPWWGSLASRMTPPEAIQNFLHGQPGVPGLLDTDWHSGSLGYCVQRVQRSAFSDGSNYSAFEAFAYYVHSLYSGTPPPTPPAPPTPPPLRHPGKPVVSTAAFNRWVHQPDGKPHVEIRVAFRAAALHRCGNPASRMARAGVVDAADHGFAVASLKKFQGKLHAPTTGVMTQDQLLRLGDTAGSKFNAAA